MILTRNMFIDFSCYFDIDQGHSDRFKCMVHCANGSRETDRCPGVFSFTAVSFCRVFFEAPDAFILALFPGACSFSYDWSVCFPALVQLASSLLGFSYRATHFSIHLFGRLVTSRNHRYSSLWNSLWIFMWLFILFMFQFVNIVLLHYASYLWIFEIW